MNYGIFRYIGALETGVILPSGHQYVDPGQEITAKCSGDADELAARKDFIPVPVALGPVDPGPATENAEPASAPPSAAASPVRVTPPAVEESAKAAGEASGSAATAPTGSKATRKKRSPKK